MAGGRLLPDVWFLTDARVCEEAALGEGHLHNNRRILLTKPRISFSPRVSRIEIVSWTVDASLKRGKETCSFLDC